MSSPRKTVLVTGANGYLASAVVQHFLEHGYKVRGTVRSLSKADVVKAALVPKYASSLTFVEVADMTKEGVYEEARVLDDVDIVCHVASPLPKLGGSPGDAPPNYVRDLIQPAVNGTLNILKSAAKYSQITHVIVTSSTAALRGPGQEGPDAPFVTEANWNPSTRNDADVNSNPMVGYYTSKAEAERALWQYVEVAKPHYVVATFCPPMFFGPAGLKAESAEDFGSSLGLFYALTKGAPAPFPLDGSWVDVRDIAQAHRLVVELPLTTSERFILANGSHTNDELVEFAKTGDTSVLKETAPINLDTAKVRRVLGWKSRSKKETLVDMLEYVRAQESNFAK